MVISQQATFMINSVAHTIGHKTYSRSATARNNRLLALVSFGEGHHSFHHEFPTDFRNAIEWWQYDPTKWCITLWKWMGLAYNLKTLVGVLDWGLTMDEAIELPNLVARGSSFSGEHERFDDRVERGLADRGMTLRDSSSEASGLHGVIVRSTGLEGGADSRREGVVLVD